MLSKMGLKQSMTIPLMLLAALIPLGGCIDKQVPETGSVQVLGSETVRPLAEACASEFMSKHPLSDVVVRGGGSGDGIAALLHGMTDIGMASRDISAKEREAAASKSVELTEFDLALDGIAVIVHNTNPVGTLDINQLRDIYSSAQPQNWKDLNGEAKEILMFGRGGSSGTAAVFQERVLGKAPYSGLVHRLLDNDAIVAAVATQPGAIGYTSLSALKHARGKVRVVVLRENPQAAPVLPTPETIRSGAYPVIRKLHFYTAGKPSGTVKSFINACQDMGKHGLVDKVGYVSLADPVTK
jgi:phosphate transport system substrate-binding protein